MGLGLLGRPAVVRPLSLYTRTRGAPGGIRLIRYGPEETLQHEGRPPDGEQIRWPYYDVCGSAVEGEPLLTGATRTPYYPGGAKDMERGQSGVPVPLRAPCPSHSTVRDLDVVLRSRHLSNPIEFDDDSFLFTRARGHHDDGLAGQGSI